MALDHLQEDLGREPSRAEGREVNGAAAGSAYSARSSPTRSDHREIAPIPDGRVAELEARLRRIAAELKAAGVIDDSDTLPPAPDCPQLAELTGRQREILVRLLNAQRVSVIAEFNPHLGLHRGRHAPTRGTLSLMDLTDLYRGPLEEFVARRTRLVRDTRRTDPSAANAIGKVRKPPVSVWAIDQLSIDQQRPLIELLAAAADAREAQRAVAGQLETRDGLLLASSRLRDAVESAARAADDVLEKAGHARGEDTGRRIRATLQSAATGSASDRLALWRGTLDHEIASSGFGALDGPDDDTAELAAVLAPLTRDSSRMRGQPPLPHALPNDDRLQREAAERAAKKQDAAAERARDLAKAKRFHADTLAEEARVAEREATAAEEAAKKAEEEARAAHSALSR